MARRVGVEIELGELPPARVAELVAATFGGVVEATSPHELAIDSPGLGRFKVVLDTRYRDPGTPDAPLGRVALALASEVGAALVVPTEVSTPPIPEARLGEVDRLVAALRAAGAKGTRDNLLHAFGMHLNPEVTDPSPAVLVATARAFALAHAWLLEGVAMDVSRRWLGVCTPYPEAYVGLLAGAGYAPDAAGFARDYLEHNPTRERALDLLPLLAFVDPGPVRAAVPHAKVKPRPTLHYRLPNADLDDPAWTVVGEWRRLEAVLTLAADPGGALEQLAALFRAGRQPSLSPEWREVSRPGVERCWRA